MMSCNCSTKCDCKSGAVLSKLLANSYILLLKTQNVHWNVVGSDFRSVHLMTEDHYNDLFSAVDVIAERIRMIGGCAPATFEEFTQLATINDCKYPDTCEEMLQGLLVDHKSIRDEIKAGLCEISDLKDYGTESVLTDRLAFHEKTIWMLESTLK